MISANWSVALTKIKVKLVWINKPVSRIDHLAPRVGPLPRDWFSELVRAAWRTAISLRCVGTADIVVSRTTDIVVAVSTVLVLEYLTDLLWSYARNITS